MKLFREPTNEEIMSNHGDRRNKALDEQEGAEWLNKYVPHILLILLLVALYLSL